jgi:Zn-dependent M28 family amino/carboxypeptidase
VRRNPSTFVATVAAASAAALAISANANAAVPTDTSALRNAVTAEGVFAHQQALQDIADANGGTRASGTPGFTASADYVADLLTDAGYDVTRQQFDFPFFAETAPAVFENTSAGTTYSPGDDFLTMEYSGSGDVTAPVEGVDLVLPPAAAANTSTSGCEAADFAGFTAGNVALVQRGTCSFGLKAQNAEAAGASAVVIFNEGQEGRTDVINGTLGGPGVTIPVLGASFAVGDELAGSGDTVHIFTETFFETRSTENVIADTPTGRTDRTVVVGAHLDSVENGPGINDNGSGTATILETALQMADLGISPRNRVRFAFWGAEEAGLLGSEHYVASLSKTELKEIMLNLNYDMVASPNYVRFVYDGDGSDSDPAGPNGSGRIESVFSDYFASQGLASESTPFSGRSDYGPFIAAGIPAGGLFTGAEGVKTAEQAAEYGGVAGAAYDPCYHQACDSLEPTYDTTEKAALYAALNADYDMVGNVNLDALDEMSDAAAHAALTFAMTTSSVNGTGKASDNASSTMDYKGSHLQK